MGTTTQLNAPEQDCSSSGLVYYAKNVTHRVNYDVFALPSVEKAHSHKKR